MRPPSIVGPLVLIDQPPFARSGEPVDLLLEPPGALRALPCMPLLVCPKPAAYRYTGAGGHSDVDRRIVLRVVVQCIHPVHIMGARYAAVIKRMKLAAEGMEFCLFRAALG